MGALVIGIGNRYRSDDGAGPRVVEALGAAGMPGVETRLEAGEGAALMDAWQDAARVYLVDAVSSGGRPGTIHRIEAHHERVPQDFFKYSTHAFSLAEAVEMARVLGELPPSLIIYGIEGGDFSAGDALSPAVESAVNDVTRRIAQDITDEQGSADQGGGDA